MAGEDRPCLWVRAQVRLDDHDLIAGAQILGWLAFPDRPQQGVRTIQQWLIRRQQARGEDIGSIQFALDKPNRLQQRINTLNKMLRRRLRAGDWLARRITKASAPHFRPGWGGQFAESWGLGLNALARRENQLLQFHFAEQSEIDRDTPNLIRDYWTASLPVIHLAKASLFAIADAYHREGREGWHLERTVFDPDWVAAAIEGSETTSYYADKMGLVDRGQMIRFHRD